MTENRIQPKYQKWIKKKLKLKTKFKGFNLSYKS